MCFGHVDQHGRPVEIHDSTGRACNPRGVGRDLDQCIVAGDNKGFVNASPPMVSGALHTWIIFMVSLFLHSVLKLLNWMRYVPILEDLVM